MHEYIRIISESLYNWRTKYSGLHLLNTSNISFNIYVPG